MADTLNWSERLDRQRPTPVSPPANTITHSSDSRNEGTNVANPQDPYMMIRLVSLETKYARWGFTCWLAGDAEFAALFYRGVPVMIVGPYNWYWLYEAVRPGTPQSEHSRLINEAIDVLDFDGETEVDDGEGTI